MQKVSVDIARDYNILGEDGVLVSSESVQCSSFPGVTLDEPVVQLDALLRRKSL